MTEDLRHLEESGTAPNHLGGRGVAKDMSARTRDGDTGALQGPAGNVSDACAAQRRKRSVATQEYRPGCAGRTRIAQVLRERRTDFGGQRELAFTERLAGSDPNDALAPVHVLELQAGHFIGPQSQPC
jgi:hypothetical protein